MKSIALLFLLIPSLLFSQKPIEYTEVVTVSAATKDQLYLAARKWVAENFRSSNDVVQMNDKEAGEIVGKGNFKYIPKIYTYSDAVKGRIEFDFQISVKEGRYRYSFHDFYHKNAQPQNVNWNLGLLTDANEPPETFKVSLVGKGWKKKTWDNVINATDLEMQLAIASLKKAMEKSPETDNW